MATQIKITPEVLRRTAQKMQTYSGDIKNIASNINREFNNLLSTWDGAAQDTFIATYESEYKQLLNENIPELLVAFKQQLDGVADTLEQVDQDLASQLKG